MGKSDYMERLTRAMGGRLVLAPGVGAIIRDAQGRVLLEQRSDGGEWDIPAGAVDPGETPSEAIRREVREEAGLEVQVVGVAGVFGGRRFRHTYPDGQEVEGFTVVFDCAVTGGRLRNEDGEVVRFRYVDPDAMPPLMLPLPATLFARERRAPVFV